jgi:hypothetical protein
MTDVCSCPELVEKVNLLPAWRACACLPGAGHKNSPAMENDLGAWHTAHRKLEFPVFLPDTTNIARPLQCHDAVVIGVNKHPSNQPSNHPINQPTIPHPSIHPSIHPRSIPDPSCVSLAMNSDASSIFSFVVSATVIPHQAWTSPSRSYRPRHKSQATLLVMTS